MASKVDLGLTICDIRLKGFVLPHGTPVTIAVTEDYWIVTVVQGEHQGTKFKIASDQAEESISIKL